MATKKTKTRKRRRKSPASGGTRKSRRAPRKRGYLNDIFNPTVAMNSARATISATTGAGGAIFVNKMLPATMGKLPKVAIALGLGFVASNFGFGNVGAGFTGGMMALTFQNGFLNDDASFADDDALAELPLYLDENDSPMVLEDGNFRYLEDDEVQALADAGVIELEEDDY